MALVSTMTVAAIPVPMGPPVTGIPHPVVAVEVPPAPVEEPPALVAIPPVPFQPVMVAPLGLALDPHPDMKTAVSSTGPAKQVRKTVGDGRLLLIRISMRWVIRGP